MSFYLLHRGWMDNPAFSDEPFTEKLAWVWLIQEASFEPHKVRYHSRMIEVARGQIPTSYRKLKQIFQWGNDRIRRFLNLLTNESMITLQTGTGFLIISICNYEKYQKPVKLSGTQPGTVVGTESGTQPGTNIKKGKELKENTTHTAHAEISEFQKIFDAGCAVNLALMTKSTAVIHQWLADGVTAQDAVPEIQRMAANARSWSFFTGAVMDAKATRLKPLPEGKPKFKSFTDTAFDQKQALEEIFKNVQAG